MNMYMNLLPNQEVRRLFHLVRYELKQAQNGCDYLLLYLLSNGYIIKGYVWDEPEAVAELLSEKNIVEVEGRVKELYDKFLILTVHTITPAERRDSDRGVQFRRLLRIASSVTDPYCRALFREFLIDEEFLECFTSSPAGLTIHHATQGGLLMHTLSVMYLSHLLHRMYPDSINRDILITGAFLHDIGKIRELPGSTGTAYTHEGKLLGHISIGLMLLNEKIQRIDGFPHDLAVILKHMIVSHHGIGVQPMIPEAILLNKLDSLDGTMDHITSCIEVSNGREWIPYDKALKRALHIHGFGTRNT